MIRPEVFAAVRRLEWRCRKALGNRRAALATSSHKGRGLEFEEVRPYAVGDEVRDLDAKVTARRGSLYIKRYVEERQRTFWLVLDQTKSMSLGEPPKARAALESLALIALWAAGAGDRVGFITFGPSSWTARPREGRVHVLAALARLQAHEKLGEARSSVDAGKLAWTLAPHGAVIVVASDFWEANACEAWRRASLRNDLFAVHVVSRGDVELEDRGLVRLADVETGEARWVDTSSRRARESFARKSNARLQAIEKSMRAMSAEYIPVRSDLSPLDAVLRHFSS